MAEKLADTSAPIAGESLADRARRLSSNRASQASADAMTKAQYGSTAGRDLGSKEGSTTGMPKQEAGESTTQYGARLRKWREMQAEAKDRALR